MLKDACCEDSPPTTSGDPQTPRWAHASPTPTILKASFSPPVKLTSVGLFFYTGSEPPPSVQRSPPPCFWAVQLHQGPIQLSTTPVLLFIHCSHHRDGNSISPVFIGPGPERQEPKGLFPLSPSLSPPTPPPPPVLTLRSGCIPLLQALQTAGSVSPGLCTSCSFCQEHTSLGFTA